MLKLTRAMRFAWWRLFGGDDMPDWAMRIYWRLDRLAQLHNGKDQ